MRVNIGKNQVLHVDYNGNAYAHVDAQFQTREGLPLENAHVAIYEIGKTTGDTLIAELNADMIGEASFQVVFDIIKDTKKNLRFVLLNEEGQTPSATFSVQLPLDLSNPKVQNEINRKQIEEKTRKEYADQEENLNRLKRCITSGKFNHGLGIGIVRHHKGWVLVNELGKIISVEFAKIGKFDKHALAKAKLLELNIEVQIDERGLIIDDNGCGVLTQEEFIRKKEEKEAMEREAEARQREAEAQARKAAIQLHNIKSALAKGSFYSEIGIGRVQTQYGWNLINSKGEILTEEDIKFMFGCKDKANAEWLHWSFFNDMFQPKLGVGRVRHPNGWTLINKKGDIITREVFEKIEAFDETKGIAKAKTTTRNIHVLINTQGQIVDERTGSPAGNDYLDESKIQVDIAVEQFEIEHMLPAIAQLVERLFLQRLNNSGSVSATQLMQPSWIWRMLSDYNFQKEVESMESYKLKCFYKALKERMRLMTAEKGDVSELHLSRVMNKDNWRNKVNTGVEDELAILDEFFVALERCNYSVNPTERKMAVSFVDLMLDHRNGFRKIDEADIPWVREDFLCLYKMDAACCYGDLDSFDAEQMKYDEDLIFSEFVRGYEVDLSTVKEFVKQSPRLSYEVFVDDQPRGCMDGNNGDDHIFFPGEESGKKHVIEVRITDNDSEVTTVFSTCIENCHIVRFYNITKSSPAH